MCNYSQPFLQRSVSQILQDAVQFQLRQAQGVLPLPGLPGRSGGTSGEPGLQFCDRPGQIHGEVRAQRPPGSRSGAGPSSARLLRAHPPPMGGARRQWHSCLLHRTCKETREARVDALGCDLGAAGTGACSATSAGEAETQTQSGPGCHCGLRLAGWPEQGPDRCSLVRFPGGAALNCWGGGAAWTASSERLNMVLRL